MALGDNNNNTNSNNEATYFSRVRFRSGDLSFGFSFWKGLLKLSIAQARQSYSGATEYEELNYIHLSPMKAKLLSDTLKTSFKTASYEDGRMFGVDTGVTDTRNIIAFGNDPESTEDNIKRFVTIAKVDPEGNLQNPVRFDFNSEYHFSIEWNNFEKMDCSKEYDNDLELDMFIIVLDQFVEAMTGSHSYAVMDMARFNYSRINTKIELVMDKLGIERGSGSKGKSGGDQSNSFFNKNGAGSPQNSNRGRSNTTTMEDIEDMMS